MRDLKFDFLQGSGAPVEFLTGTVIVYGTEQAANGSSWVVTSETTLRLVNGQATLVGALERPTDGSRGHLHVLVHGEYGGGASFRKFLPAGTSPVDFITLPDSWQDV